MSKKFEAFSIYETHTGGKLAEHLKTALWNRCEINCFVAEKDILIRDDEKDILIRDDEKEVGYQALKDAEEIFLIITHGTLTSEAVKEEIQWAGDEKKIKNVRPYLKNDVDVSADYTKDFLKNMGLNEKQYFKFKDKCELADDVIKRILDKEYFGEDIALHIRLSEGNLNRSSKATYWVDGIPKSDDKELKEHYLKALLLCRNDKYEDAIKEFENILRICIISPTEKMSILLNLGNAYYSLSQNDKALENYNASLRVTEKVGKKTALEGKAAALGNIGLIYSDKGDLDNALKYHQDALKIDREIGYKQGETLALGNIGLIYLNKGDLDNALKYHQDALKIDREIGYKQGETLALGNIGLIYLNKGDLDNALKYLKKALKVLEKFNLIYGKEIIKNAVNFIERKKQEMF